MSREKTEELGKIEDLDMIHSINKRNSKYIQQSKHDKDYRQSIQIFYTK